jgi:tRNA(Ile)-lysidine synthase
LQRGERIVVGFSGGRDSLALAAALRWAEKKLGIEVLLVHVDHGLRESSGEEAEQAEALAGAIGRELRVERVHSTLTQLRSGVGMEEGARRARYAILFAVAGEVDAHAVATAHHERDQAETVLLHLLRGGGLHGAAAMRERSPAPVLSHDISQEVFLWLWRPLLSESREAIEDYVSLLRLTPVDDPSNEDIAVRRNFLRHEILPRLEERFPGAVASLSRYAKLAAEDDRVLADLAAELLVDAVDSSGTLQAAKLREQPLAMRRRMVRQWLEAMIGSAMLAANRTDAIVELAGARRGGRAVEVGEGWMVRVARGALRLERWETDQDREGER